ncbi:hypothetical protein C8Q73DRAFT_207707 [Cubamyces lactineus]|nr:hypothetical protein C8Q73DRAFT_207707 [Cubamyces lactineus]
MPAPYPHWHTYPRHPHTHSGTWTIIVPPWHAPRGPPIKLTKPPQLYNHTLCHLQGERRTHWQRRRATTATHVWPPDAEARRPHVLSASSVTRPPRSSVLRAATVNPTRPPMTNSLLPPTDMEDSPFRQAQGRHRADRHRTRATRHAKARKWRAAARPGEAFHCLPQGDYQRYQGDNQPPRPQRPLPDTLPAACGGLSWTPPGTRRAPR